MSRYTSLAAPSLASFLVFPEAAGYSLPPTTNLHQLTTQTAPWISDGKLETKKGKRGSGLLSCVNRSEWGGLLGSDGHPVSLPVQIEPARVVGGFQLNSSERSFGRVFCLSGKRQHANNSLRQTFKAVKRTKWFSLTESAGLSNRCSNAFLAAFCLASFLFFPTPSG